LERFFSYHKNQEQGRKVETVVDKKSPAFKDCRLKKTPHLKDCRIVIGTKGGLFGFISSFSILAVTAVGLWGLISLSSVLISCFVCLFYLYSSSRISLNALSSAFASTYSFSSHVGLK